MVTALHDLLGTFYRAFSGDHTLLDGVVAHDWQDLPPAPGQLPGPAGGAQVIEAMNAAVSNLRIVVVDVVDGRGADGNGSVAVRATLSGVHTGDLMGVRATGRQFEIALHEFHQIADQRILTTWHLEDWFGFFNQVKRLPGQ